MIIGMMGGWCVGELVALAATSAGLLFVGVGSFDSLALEDGVDVPSVVEMGLTDVVPVLDGDVL